MVKLTPSGKEALDDLATSVATGGKLPGFVFGATTANEEIYFKSVGKKVFGDSASGDVEPNSTLWVCSQTKMIAHIAALQLIEQGKFTQSTLVSEFFPEFANLIVLDDLLSKSPTFKPAKTPMTVKHLLNFSSGLDYNYPAWKDPFITMTIPYAAAHDMQDPHSTFFKLIKGDLPGIPLKFEPGTDFAYGYSSDVLGFIVEKVSGKTLEHHFQEYIFKPLGMKGSFYLTPELEKNMLTLTYRRNGALEPWNYQPETTLIERDPTKVSRHFGGGGLYISLRSYLALLRHLLQIHAGKVANPILKQETVHEMFVPTLTEAGSKSLDAFTADLPPGGQWSTALGVVTADWPNRRKKGSAFWYGWAGTYFWMDPTTGIAGMFGTQIIPSGDIDVIRTYTAFEETLYAGLD